MPPDNLNLYRQDAAERRRLIAEVHGFKRQIKDLLKQIADLKNENARLRQSLEQHRTFSADRGYPR